MWMLLTPLLVALAAVVSSLAVSEDATSQLRNEACGQIAEAFDGPLAAKWNREVEVAWIDDVLPTFPLKGRCLAWGGLVMLRGRLALTWALPLICLACAVGAASFASRAKITSVERVPSPAIAFLAKRGAVLSGAGVLLCVALPVATPAVLVPVLAVAAILLFGIYVANLPDQL